MRAPELSVIGGAPRGKLPVTIHARNADGTLGPVRYARGFGLQY